MKEGGRREEGKEGGERGKGEREGDKREKHLMNKVVVHNQYKYRYSTCYVFVQFLREKDLKWMHHSS